jgi:hypothetical protein
VNKVRQKLINFDPGVYEEVRASLERENAHPAVKVKLDMDGYINKLLVAACHARQSMKEAPRDEAV